MSFKEPLAPLLEITFPKGIPLGRVAQDEADARRAAAWPTVRVFERGDTAPKCRLIKTRELFEITHSGCCIPSLALRVSVPCETWEPDGRGHGIDGRADLRGMVGDDKRADPAHAGDPCQQ